MTTTTARIFLLFVHNLSHERPFKANAGLVFFATGHIIVLKTMTVLNTACSC